MIIMIIKILIILSVLMIQGEVHQLMAESLVLEHARPALVAQELDGVDKAEALAVDEVRGDERDAAVDARDAVHEDLGGAAAAARGVDEADELLVELQQDVAALVVGHRQVEHADADAGRGRRGRGSGVRALAGAAVDEVSEALLLHQPPQRRIAGRARRDGVRSDRKVRQQVRHLGREEKRRRHDDLLRRLLFGIHQSMISILILCFFFAQC